MAENNASTNDTRVGIIRSDVTTAEPAHADDTLSPRFLDELLAAVFCAHPKLSVAEGELRSHFESLLRDAVVTPGELSARATDIGTAFAATRGDPAALAALDVMLKRAATPAIRRMKLDDSRLDEVLQRLRVSLTVGSAERAPKLLSYSGTGPLEAWLRVTAIRTACSLLGERGERSVTLEEAAFASAAAKDNPEIEVFAQRYAQPLHEAVKASLQELTDRQRAILRFYLVEELTIDQLAVIYQIHRATAARWVRDARMTLADDIRARFCSSVGTTASEFFSILKDVMSYLDFRIEGMLSGEATSIAADVEKAT